MIETLKNLPNVSALLKRNHVDLRDMQTDRQVFFMARKLSGSRIAWPQRHEPVFPALLKLDRELRRG